MPQQFHFLEYINRIFGTVQYAMCAYTESYLPPIIPADTHNRTGPPGYVGWRNRGFDSLTLIPGLHKPLQIRAQTWLFYCLVNIFISYPKGSPYILKGQK